MEIEDFGLSFALGLVFLFGYGCRCAQGHARYNLGIIFGMFFLAAGVTTGGYLMVLPFDP